MRLLVLAVLLLIVSGLSAQNVGIGSTAFTPDPSAGLEVQYSDKGVLIPRVELWSENDGFTISSPATSLLVYNTEAAFLNPEGFYYNSGTPASPHWTILLSEETSNDMVWALGGNSGTYAGNDFIGTTDDEDFVIRTNNTEHIRITTSGQIEFLNTGRSVFIGESAGENDSHAINNNVFVGSYAGTNNTVGTNNVAIGSGSLYKNTSGFCNTVLGRSAGSNNTSGYHNIALGYQSLYYNTTGYTNSALSPLSLYNNTTGNANVAAGYKALYDNADGDYNTAYGHLSLYENTSGYDNTAVGRDALKMNTTGNGNTAIGAFSYANGSYNNSTAVGYLAMITSSNQVRIGDASVVTIGGYANWTSVSDGRFKEKVKADIPGLDFIMLLEPVTYNVSTEKINEFLQIPDSIISMEGSGKSEIRYSGFIAQDVEKSAQSIGYDFSGIDAPQNEQSHYGLRYAEFVVPLVKATQEQQVIIEAQGNEIMKLKDENIEMKQQLESLQQQVNELMELMKE